MYSALCLRTRAKCDPNWSDLSGHRRRNLSPGRCTSFRDRIARNKKALHCRTPRWQRAGQTPPHRRGDPFFLARDLETRPLKSMSSVLELGIEVRPVNRLFQIFTNTVVLSSRRLALTGASSSRQHPRTPSSTIPSRHQKEATLPAPVGPWPLTKCQVHTVNKKQYKKSLNSKTKSRTWRHNTKFCYSCVSFNIDNKKKTKLEIKENLQRMFFYGITKSLMGSTFEKTRHLVLVRTFFSPRGVLYPYRVHCTRVKQD
jgi:hypothetical protein